MITELLFLLSYFCLKSTVGLERIPFISKAVTQQQQIHTPQISTMHRRGTSAGLHTPVDTGLTSVLCFCVCVCARLSGWRFTEWAVTPLTSCCQQQLRGGVWGAVWHGLKKDREGGWRVT